MVGRKLWGELISGGVVAGEAWWVSERGRRGVSVVSKILSCEEENYPSGVQTGG